MNSMGFTSCLERGVSMNTLLNLSVRGKNSFSLYISDESIQRRVFSGSNSKTLIPSEVSSDTIPDTISALFCSDMESWVLQSNRCIFSISSPQKDIR